MPGMANVTWQKGIFKKRIDIFLGQNIDVLNGEMKKASQIGTR